MIINIAFIRLNKFAIEFLLLKFKTTELLKMNTELNIVIPFF